MTHPALPDGDRADPTGAPRDSFGLGAAVALCALQDRPLSADEVLVAKVAVVHRVGALAVGDLAVIVGAAAAHRGAAFAAARDLIDQLKATVPIWKHQGFTDGSTEWVGLP